MFIPAEHCAGRITPGRGRRIGYDMPAPSLNQKARSPVTATFSDSTAQFLAPPTAAEAAAAHRAPDCDPVAMHQLRRPFATATVPRTEQK
jgi:hypothetical protein